MKIQYFNQFRITDSSNLPSIDGQIFYDTIEALITLFFDTLLSLFLETVFTLAFDFLVDLLGENMFDEPLAWGLILIIFITIGGIVFRHSLSYTQGEN